MMTRAGKGAFDAIRVFAAVMSFVAVGRHPYSFYMIARCVLAPVSAYTASVACEEGRTGWSWTFAAMALLFNPFIPPRLDRIAWQCVDLTTGLLMLSSIMFIKPVVRREK